MPDSFCETDDGLLLVANGIDPMARWDGLASQASPAGIPAPATAPVVGSSGSGAIVGTFSAYVRFKDADGLLSDLSPVSDEADVSSTSGAVSSLAVYDQAAIDALAEAGASASTIASLTALIDHPVQVITAAAHGLVSGVFVKLTGLGFAAIDGTYEVIVDGPTSFRLRDLIDAGDVADYGGGGTWTAGVASIVYTSVPVPNNPRVKYRQILRNTDGQATTYYVDVETEDLQAATFSSTRDDEELAAQEEAPLLDEDGAALANRHGVPPNWKSVVAAHLSRVYAAVDVVYDEGCAVVETGSLTVTGVGTEWRTTFAGRFFYAAGASRAYEIESCDEDEQTLTLTEPYLDAADPYARYAIEPAPGERELVYYSEAGLPESWPATNAVTVSSDGDELTAIAVSNSFVFFCKKRHVYKLTVQDDPATDGRVYLNLDGRGCLNHRCWAEVEGRIFMLDEQGVHAFDGSGDTEPLSTPIQDVFRDRDGPYSVNWRARRYFHCVHFAQQEVIRWFVSLGGSHLPRHALAFNHRLSRWWIEEYPFPVGASCVSEMNGLPCVLIGSDAKRVFKLWEGTLDGPAADAGTVRGTATSAGLLWLTDALAEFPSSGVTGAPLQIVDGAGKGQGRRIVEADGTTLRVDRPWLVMPDATSVYQVGGVRWKYLSGWYRFEDNENQNPRRVELIFDPVAQACLADVRLYRDFSGEPIEWSTPYTSADANGFRSERDSAYLVGDLTKTTGYLQKKFSGHKEFLTDGPRFWSVELSGVQNAEPVRVSEITLQGVRQS
jgi:hypothetical protein